MITSLVLVMMLIIEYINVVSKGRWGKNISESRIKQIFIAALLGLIPGCVGSFAVVSLYTHHVMSFGALVANMIASSGDESFVMFSLFPSTALKLNIIVFVLAIVTGIIVNFFIKKSFIPIQTKAHLVVHQQENETPLLDLKNIVSELKSISLPRAALIFGLLIFIFGIITGQFEHAGLDISSFGAHTTHSEGGFHLEEILFLLISIIALFLIVIVKEHFLEEHLWDHIIKKHFLKIFLWTFGALLAIHFLMLYVDPKEWIDENKYIILALAVLIGVIPESGPHLAIVVFFYNGAMPFSILLANSIVQDGHGAIPLLAESKKSFFLMKFINMAVAFLVGLAGIGVGF